METLSPGPSSGTPAKDRYGFARGKRLDPDTAHVGADETAKGRAAIKDTGAFLVYEKPEEISRVADDFIANT